MITAIGSVSPPAPKTGVRSGDDIQKWRAADRRTLRRALRAGAVTTAALSLLAVAGNIAFGGDGMSASIWIASALVVGLLVASGWMVLALLVDLIAGEVPAAGRVIWTAALFILAFVSPVLPAAMLQMAAGR